jgi:hypothetical protein
VVLCGFMTSSLWAQQQPGSPMTSESSAQPSPQQAAHLQTVLDFLEPLRVIFQTLENQGQLSPEDWAMISTLLSGSTGDSAQLRIQLLEAQQA